VALEVVAAAAARKEPPVVVALARWNESLAAAKDPMARWLPALDGGDPAAGERLYESHPAAQCVRCHAAGASHRSGGETGPDLGGVARRGDRRFLLESLVVPEARVAPGYATVSLGFANGATMAGTLVRETPQDLDIEAADGFWRVQRAEVVRMSAASPMPPMGQLLQPGELRDLVAWLATLEEAGQAVPEPRAPKPFDPAR
jgi:putative heme-binding domain-containing protein